jgi:hypothetical protein
MRLVVEANSPIRWRSDRVAHPISVPRGHLMALYRVTLIHRRRLDYKLWWILFTHVVDLYLTFVKMPITNVI